MELTAIIHQRDEAAQTNRQRAAPALILERDTGGTWTPLATSATGYIRDISGHDESSNTIAFVDVDPGTDPTYRLMFREESNERDSTIVQSGQFAGRAFMIP